VTGLLLKFISRGDPGNRFLLFDRLYKNFLIPRIYKTQYWVRFPNLDYASRPIETLGMAHPCSWVWAKIIVQCSVHSMKKRDVLSFPFWPAVSVTWRAQILVQGGTSVSASRGMLSKGISGMVQSKPHQIWYSAPASHFSKNRSATNLMCKANATLKY